MALCHCSLQTVHRRGSRKFQFVQDCKRTGCRQGRCSLASRTDYWIKRAESVLRWDFAQWKMGSNCSTLHRRLLWFANVLQTVSYFSISPTDQVLYRIKTQINRKWIFVRTYWTHQPCRQRAQIKSSEVLYTYGRETVQIYRSIFFRNILHPDYSGLNNDFALLRMRDPFNLPDIQHARPACLPDSSLTISSGTNVRKIFFGILAFNPWNNMYFHIPALGFRVGSVENRGL